MLRRLNQLVLITCVLTLAGLAAPGQSLRTITVGAGLGHLVHGVGNEPLRLCDDALAIISDGTTEGGGIVDDQLLVVSGFQSGLLSLSTVNLYTALGAYGDLPRTLIRLGDRSFSYYDRGATGHAPSLVVVSDAGATNLVTVHPLGHEAAFDVDQSPAAALDESSLVWAAVGRDGVAGTADDRIGYAIGVSQAPASVGSILAPQPLAPGVVALSSTRAVARGLGADGVAGTSDDALVLIDRSGRSIVASVLPLLAGAGSFVHARGPVLVGKDTLVYPAAGAGATSLYLVVRNLLSAAPTVVPFGSPVELPPASALLPEPVGIGRDYFVYANAGANRVFHDGDDEVRVGCLGASVTTRTFTPGLGIGLADTTIPPAHLGGARTVFGSVGPDGLPGTADDGVLVAEGLDTVAPAFTLVTTGVEALSLSHVNDSSVAMMAIDGTLAFVQGLGAFEPSLSQFVQAIGCGSCFKRLNDWTLVGTAMVSTLAAGLLDEIVTVQFPFVETYGDAQLCASGHGIGIDRTVRPVLGTNWPATMTGGDTGMPAALMLSWYAADLPLNGASRFYLDPAFVLGSEVMLVDVAGEARVYLYLEPLPWLPGFSFCGQWGMYDPAGYAGVCVSSGFRVHF